MNDYELSRIKRQSFVAGLKQGQQITCKTDFIKWLLEILKETKGVGEKTTENIINKAYELKKWEE